jgi:hypothetical protein
MIWSTVVEMQLLEVELIEAEMLEMEYHKEGEVV